LIRLNEGFGRQCEYQPVGRNRKIGACVMTGFEE